MTIDPRGWIIKSEGNEYWKVNEIYNLFWTKWINWELMNYCKIIKKVMVKYFENGVYVVELMGVMGFVNKLEKEK